MELLLQDLESVQCEMTHDLILKKIMTQVENSTKMAMLKAGDRRDQMFIQSLAKAQGKSLEQRTIKI